MIEFITTYTVLIGIIGLCVAAVFVLVAIGRAREEHYDFNRDHDFNHND